VHSSRRFKFITKENDNGPDMVVDIEVSLAACCMSLFTEL
jgi:hypothetical protein